MAETYCGKSCEACSERASLHCPGCKVGPGQTYSGDCELAKCVRTKGHETCDTCTTKGYCGNFRNCQHFPVYRLRKQDAERQQLEIQKRRAPLFGKWLWILFWLVIPNSIAGLIGNETLFQSVPFLYLTGQLLKAACSLVYGVILLKLGSEEDHFRTAGICLLIAAVLSLLVGIFSGHNQQPLLLLLAIPTLVVALIGEYNEYMGYSTILKTLDPELSDKWNNLWKWYIGLLLGVLGCVVLILLMPLLAALALLAAAVGLLVVNILKLVNLYRTANLFRQYAATMEETPL